jgi:membrane fusion protein, multidrug efflux system
VVTERIMSPGEYRSEQSHMLTLAAVDPLHVEVFLPVSYYTALRPGGSAVVRPAAPIGGEHPARIAVVDPVIDAPSGTFGLRLELPNPAGTIPAGLRCTIRFQGAG